METKHNLLEKNPRSNENQHLYNKQTQQEYF